MPTWLTSAGDDHPSRTVRLGAADQALLAGPAGRPVPIVALFDFDGPAPSVEGLRARVAERAEHLPALRYRIGDGGRTAEWSDRLDTDRHVRVLAAGGESSHVGAELLLNQGPPADKDRPPWNIVLIPRPGEYSLAFHGDHGLYDGGVAALVLALLDDNPTAAPPLPLPRRPPAAGLISALAQQIALLRASRPTPAFSSPQGPTRKVRYADVALTYLRDLAHAHRVSVNDIYLAALAHAVHLWQGEQSDKAHPPVITGMPVSFRGPGQEGALGNHMALTRIVLPCDEPSPLQALHLVAAQTARHKRLRQRDALRVLSALTPGGATKRLFGRLGNPLTASNVVLGGPLTYRGNAARAAYGVTDTLGPDQCYTCLVTYQNTARLSVVHHSGTPVGPLLPDLWRTALQAIEHANDPPVGSSDALQRGVRA
ncbi:wax ester/triacylglycerol synthase domain-containing protein [Streptomyces sp. NPDC016459]|uniref:wax ester/triacylglycerol synthase domain-containing protein n=1 Tax=Streptomyces sp. NPDC016459 TaxID=3157190 RepID=UPI0033F0949F